MCLNFNLLKFKTDRNVTQFPQVYKMERKCEEVGTVERLCRIYFSNILIFVFFQKNSQNGVHMSLKCMQNFCDLASREFTSAFCEMFEYLQNIN